MWCHINIRKDKTKYDIMIHVYIKQNVKIIGQSYKNIKEYLYKRYIDKYTHIYWYKYGMVVTV
jgi:hypothetical protein